MKKFKAKTLLTNWQPCELRLRQSFLWHLYSKKFLLTITVQGYHISIVYCILSSPEPKAHMLAYRIPMVRRPSSSVRCCPSTISNVFSSETAGPIKAKFYVEPPWEGGTKVYINGTGHMTKM